MQLTASDIARYTDGTLQRCPPDRHLSDVVTDSRTALPPHALFVALRGPNFDGHDFVDEAFENGAALALVDDDRWDARPERPVVVVEDTLRALQCLATRWRERFDIPVIGITGSNGKTIVKDMLAGILAQEFTVHRSPASYNSQVGVPLSLLGLRPQHEVAVIEAGISQVGEMEALAEMIQPTIGTITNIGLAHAAGLKTLHTTAREKLKLFRELNGPLAVPADSTPLSNFDLPGRPVRFAAEDSIESADYAACHAKRHTGTWSFDLHWPDGHAEPMTLKAPGRHNLQNAACAASLAAELGISPESIRRGFASYEPVPLRTEMHTTPAGITLINDAYSSDPVSARAALSTLDNYAGGRRNIAILGDMLDLGARSRAEHRRLGNVVARNGVDCLICYGPRAADIGEAAAEAGFPTEHIEHVEAMRELHELLDDLLEPDDVVLFKASRSLELDRAAERLLESVAPTRLRIDLDALSSNYHAIRKTVGDDVDFMAVVKSFGYGNDATRVSQTLVSQGVDMLAVAYPDEAIPLRRRGLSLPILVYNVVASEADKIAKYDLTALVYTRSVVEALARRAKRQSKRVGVHIKVDTGMNRVGLSPDEVLPFAQWLAELDAVQLTGIMTHFAAADEPAQDAFTREQIARFSEVVDRLRANDLAPETVHAANTAAAWRFPEAYFDMVRVGLGIYGLAPSEAVIQATDGVRPALTLTTQVIHLHEVEDGETVGYGRTWRADGTRRIATIAAGYNDGLPRFMSNGGEVLIKGRRCSIVGNVCMDVAMVDVTHLDTLDVGAEVVLFGAQDDEYISVDEMAERGDTINYEILCNISDRVRRIFVRRS